MPADVGGGVYEYEAEPRADEPVLEPGQLYAPEDEELRDDVQKARHHQREEIELEDGLPAREVYARKAVGRERRDEHRRRGGEAGVYDAVLHRRREDVHAQDVRVG